MHLNDWNAYRRQLVAAVGDFAKLSPDTVKGYVTLGSAGQKVGRLGNKTRELIALAAAISLRCDGCIAVHAAAAREHGATKEEISARCRRRHQRGGGSRLLDPRVGCVRRRRRSLTPLWKGAFQCLPISACF
jgi:AhpD family alkylhydroperoxidase